MEEKESGVLVVLGQNWAKGPHGKPRNISVQSFFTTLAAMQLAQTGKFHTLIFSTGHTNGRKQISEAEAMANILHQLNPTLGIPVLCETASYDTSTNLKEVQKIIAQEHLPGPVALLTPTYHAVRTRRLARGLGMDVSIIPVEEVTKTPLLRGWGYEPIARALSLFDSQGRLPRFFAQRRTRG